MRIRKFPAAKVRNNTRSREPGAWSQVPG